MVRHSTIFWQNYCAVVVYFPLVTDDLAMAVHRAMVAFAQSWEFGVKDKTAECFSNKGPEDGRSVGRTVGRSRAYFVELGTCVVLEQTQAFAVQPPVMSLPLFKVGKCFLLVPNHKTQSQFVRIVFVRKQILNKGGKKGFGLDIFQHAVLPGCPCLCNEPSSLPSPPWSSASWCV